MRLREGLSALRSASVLVGGAVSWRRHSEATYFHFAVFANSKEAVWHGHVYIFASPRVEKRFYSGTRIQSREGGVFGFRFR